MRYVFVLMLVGLLSGCGGPAQQYILSEARPGKHVLRSAPAQIGIDRVAMPAYLSGNKIPIQSAEGELTFCDAAVWASAPEKGATQHLIAYMQKHFSSPNVYRYPWDIERTSGLRLKVVITKMIYVESKGVVVLEANYFVETLRGKRRRAKLFSTHVSIRKGETPLIVVGMNRALDRLAADAASMIAHF